MVLDYDRLEKLRQARGFNKNELLAAARHVRPTLGRNTLYRVLNGKQVPTLETVRALADALNTTPDYLMGFIDDPWMPGEAPLPEPDLAHIVVELNKLSPFVRRSVGDIVEAVLELLRVNEHLDKHTTEDVELSNPRQRWMRLLDELSHKELEEYVVEFEERVNARRAAEGTGSQPLAHGEAVRRKE